jgi:hypothetical protein
MKDSIDHTVREGGAYRNRSYRTLKAGIIALVVIGTAIAWRIES